MVSGRWRTPETIIPSRGTSGAVRLRAMPEYTDAAQDGVRQVEL
jgi:hypothetical protein